MSTGQHTILDFERSLADLDKNISAYRQAAEYRDEDYSQVIAELSSTRERLLKEIFEHLTPWDEVLLARHKERPYSLDYIKALFTEFFELHGDRLSSDDQAVVTGLARFNGTPVAIVAQQKGRDLKERQQRNFGYARPAGYRKALRVMKMAEKVGIPVISLVDTPGADPNVQSEEFGISASIACNLKEMAVLSTPIICAVIGEGGSGGALGLAIADRILMMEHAIYSVIAPEGCAAIMDTFGRDPSRASEAAAALRVSAKSALEFNLIDEIVAEPVGGAHRDFDAAASSLGASLASALAAVSALNHKALLRERHIKFRKMGKYKSAIADHAGSNGFKSS